jgi:two-component system, NtrC family, sensor kinase
MPSERRRSTLRVQILGAVGAVIVVLLTAISLGVLRQARSYIIEQQTRRAESAAHAFAIAVVDAFIVGEQIRSVAGDLLENHIRRFASEVDDVLHIGIVDRSGRVIAHSDPSLYGTILPDTAALRVSRAAVPMTAMFRGPTGHWVVETVVPLQVGTRRWGTAFMGFDAEPTRQQVSRLFTLLLVLMVLATTTTLGVLYLFIDRLTAALEQLVVEVDRMDFESDEPITVAAPNNEVGYLVDRFQSLKGRLSHSRAQLAAAQRQAYQAEKLASIGRLAAGVAHEVNNPLNGMRFCLHGLRSEPANAEQTVGYAGLIGEGISRIESVVQKLLGFARHRPATFEDVAMNEQVGRVLDLLSFQAREKGIAVELALDARLPAVRGDANEVQELIMNLLLNSIDAAPHGGSILVRTGCVPDGVFLSITDNGTGIAPEYMDRIFEPFFSTKEPGSGTGLGLAVAQGIVERHGGRIAVHSVPGRKTTFTTTFPLQEPG